MAGNVKEWVWNESSGGRRFVLGGAWFEAAHAFHDEDARSPFTRDAGFGFRCMQQLTPIDAALVRPVVTLAPDPAALAPVGDEVFQVYRRLYDYDAQALDSRVDERDDTQAEWIVERVSFTAAYGTDRLPVILMLPRSARPPYQAVVYFPGSDAVRARSSRGAYTQWVQFVVRSGRAVAFPIYQQTYERRRTSTGGGFLREISIQRGQDVRRTIDYLASRSDIDATKIAFYGVSLGAQLAPVYLAVEPRLRTGVLLSGGFETWTVPPETDPVNFASRVRQPVLMVNGREDFDLPYDTAQVPLFNMSGHAGGRQAPRRARGRPYPAAPGGSVQGDPRLARSLPRTGESVGGRLASESGRPFVGHVQSALHRQPDTADRALVEQAADERHAVRHAAWWVRTSAAGSPDRAPSRCAPRATCTKPARSVSDGWPVKLPMVSISSRSDGTSSRSTSPKMRAISPATRRRSRSAWTKSTAERNRASRNRFGHASGTCAFI